MNVLEDVWTNARCEYTPNAISPYLVALYFAHYAVTAFIFLEGVFRTRELYLLLLSIGIAFNYWLNVFLKALVFRQPIPVPTCGYDAVYCLDAAAPPHHNACGEVPISVIVGSPPLTCGLPGQDACLPCVPCGMPALEPQLVAFIVVNVGVFALQYRGTRISWYHAYLLTAFFAVVVYTHVYIGFNSPAQVLAGVGIGAVMALIWELSAARLLEGHFTQILEWPLIRSWGYKNTLMHDEPE